MLLKKETSWLQLYSFPFQILHHEGQRDGDGLRDWRLRRRTRRRRSEGSTSSGPDVVGGHGEPDHHEGRGAEEVHRRGEAAWKVVEGTSHSSRLRKRHF